MSNLEIENDKNWEKTREKLYYGSASENSKLIDFFIRHGLDTKQSYYAIALIVIICLFMSYQMLKGTFSTERPVYFEDFPQEQLDLMTETERNALPRKSR